MSDGEPDRPGAVSRSIRTQTGMDGSTLLRNVEIRYPGASGYGGIYANHAAGVTMRVDDVTVFDTNS